MSTKKPLNTIYLTTDNDYTTCLWETKDIDGIKLSRNEFEHWGFWEDDLECVYPHDYATIGSKTARRIFGEEVIEKSKTQILTVHIVEEK